jgi:hypothetical protein
MGYEILTDHPESEQRREADFTAWLYWSQQHAPWSGVGIDEMAEIVSAVCADASSADLCEVLDQGGRLDLRSTERVLHLAWHQMSEDIRTVLQSALAGGYGIRVVFSKGAFGKAVSASEYAAKFGSASEH